MTALKVRIKSRTQNYLCMYVWNDLIMIFVLCRFHFNVIYVWMDEWMNDYEETNLRIRDQNSSTYFVIKWNTFSLLFYPNFEREKIILNATPECRRKFSIDLGVFMCNPHNFYGCTKFTYPARTFVLYIRFIQIFYLLFFYSKKKTIIEKGWYTC